MTLPLKHRVPTIWMNMTTSRNWNRPPVGIVRVEQALCNELREMLGDDRFRQCLWLENRFVECLPQAKPVANAPHVVANIGSVTVPSARLIERSRKFAGRIYRALRWRLIERLSPSSVQVISRFIQRSKRFSGRVGRALNRRLGASVSAAMAPVNSVRAAMSVNADGGPGPIAGDVLISIGLDWDHPYVSEFHRIAKNGGIKIITCCYDLIPVIYPQFCVGDVASKFTEYLYRLSWGSSGVLCISEQTRRDYEALCLKIGAPQPPTCVITLGDSLSDQTGEISEQINDLMARPFILFVSTIERRKNHEVLYRAYHLLCKAGQRDLLPIMVFVGMPGWGVGDLLKDIEIDPLTQDLIVQLNHVSDAELNNLYKNALFCVYPSLYEGWGLPVAEALALGKALLVSDQGSLPEVGGDLVAYLPPWNAQAWADGILDLLTSPEKIKAMESRVRQEYKVHRWAETAVKVVSFIEQLTAGEPSDTITLYPGYDFRTTVGLPVASAMQSTGIAGLLMAGPCRALANGVYRVQIFDECEKRSSGELALEFFTTRKNQKSRLWQEDVRFTSGMATNAGPLIEFEFVLEEAVQEYEIICHVDSGGITLNRVTITRQSLANANPVFPALRMAADEPASPSSGASQIKTVASLTVPPKQLFVDISELVHQDAKTGIQRVVRSVLAEFLENPPTGFRVEPVYARVDQGYRYARQFTWRVAGGNIPKGPDEPIVANKGDVFLGLDLQPHVVLRQEDFYAYLQAVGVKTHFVVYDVLPILMPHYFPKGTAKIYRQWLATLAQATGVMCISRAVAAELTDWLKQHDPARLSTSKIGWFHLGADVSSSLPSKGLPITATIVFEKLRQRPTFLMVGTLEPRKGHAQTLQAFEQLWHDNMDLNLVIVGKQGWMMEDLCNRICLHKEYTHRLFWLDRISDEYLEQIYAASTCLIAASEGEGFGLPLIEAAHFNLPLIVRDIPVFREVAEDHAFYFSGTNHNILALAVADWLQLFAEGNAPSSVNISRLTWKKSTEDLWDGIRPVPRQS